MPKVSIVVPIYNAEKYLRQCLNSIVNQTLRDIEIICVNDGSTDNSLKIAQEYAEKDNRVIVISKPNAGYGHSMNNGLDIATGEYFGIVDADDYILPDMYETLYEYAVKDDLDMIRGAYYKFYISNGIEKRTYWNSMGKQYRDVVYCPRKCSDFFMSAVLTPSGIYKIDFIKSNGIRYNETPGAAFQDHGFWFKTHLLANRVLFIDRAFYLYRFDNPNSSIYSKSCLEIMSNEYDQIKVFVDNHPELKYVSVPFYWKARFLNCQLTYSRLINDINNVSVRPLSKPFIEADAIGELDTSLMATSTIDSVYELINTPKKFCRKLKVATAYSLYNEHIQRELEGIEKGQFYKLQWYWKRFGIKFALYISSKKSVHIVKGLIKKKIKILAAKYFSLKARINPNYIKKKKLESQLLDFFVSQSDYKYRNDQIFWWSINRPNETLSETKQRFFLNMPKAEGSLRFRQNEYVAVLVELKKILDENNILFWLMGGTMVGALRHNGFIPWDDDIDISMMYKDKDKLFELIRQSNTLCIDEVYWCGNTVLRCPRVKFKDTSRIGLVDIFFWETATEEPTGFKALWRKRNICSAKMNREYQIIKPKLHYLYNGEPITDSHDAKLLETIFNQNRKQCVKMCGTGGSTIYGAIDMWFQAGNWLAVYAKEDVFPMRNVQFEGTSYHSPCSSEKFLTDQYGDWQAIPNNVSPSHGG